jgi:hypothetical protein
MRTEFWGENSWKAFTWKINITTAELSSEHGKWVEVAQDHGGHWY